jgi:hypothetical protein
MLSEKVASTRSVPGGNANVAAGGAMQLTEGTPVNPTVLGASPDSVPTAPQANASPKS